MSFDPRILRIGVQIGKEVVWLEGLALECGVTKTASPQSANEATIKVTNLSREHRNQLLTETTPFNTLKARKQIIIEAGRQSYGASRIFVGDIISAAPGQPPDISITIKARTNNWFKMVPISKSYPATTQCRRVAQDIADMMGLSLMFEASDKAIASYAFTGAASQQLNKLAEIGRVNAYIDDDRLVVKDMGKGVNSNRQTNELNIDSGMVGIPEVTEQGIRVRMMFEPFSRCGGLIRVRSIMNPAADGPYIIYKLTYDLTNRNDAFYTTVEGYKQGRYLNGR